MSANAITQVLSAAPAGLCPACGSKDVVAWQEGPDRFHNRADVYQLLRCRDCSVVSLDNPPAPEQMDRHYGREYHNFITAAGEHSSPRWQNYRRIVERYKRDGGSVLDLGCSSGSFLAAMAGPSWELHGIEISASVAEEARARTGADIFVGDVLEAPFAEGSFDVITAFDVLEHLYSPQAVLRKIHKWLKPGGIFFLVVPNIDSWESRLFHSYWYGLELPRHLIHFSPDSLTHAATSAGLKRELLTTPPVNYLEHSSRYVWDAMLRKAGVKRPSVSSGSKPSFAWKVVRRGLRMTAVALFGHTASLANSGPSIEAIFRKDSVGQVRSGSSSPHAGPQKKQR
jgi:2-polyprenyl-3-methyl-5-hydroxy-6-metoxy-1,4-benzoquinol methylase